VLEQLLQVRDAQFCDGCDIFNRQTAGNQFQGKRLCGGNLALLDTLLYTFLENLIASYPEVFSKHRFFLPGMQLWILCTIVPHDGEYGRMPQFHCSDAS